MRLRRTQRQRVSHENDSVYDLIFEMLAVGKCSKKKNTEVYEHESKVFPIFFFESKLE